MPESKFRISRTCILTLLGGTWPEADGFFWKSVEYFRRISPDHLQGFTGDEPIGPAIKYSVRVLSIDESLGVMSEPEVVPPLSIPRWVNLNKYRALVLVDNEVEEQSLHEAGDGPEQLIIQVGWGKIGNSRKLCWFTHQHGKPETLRQEERIGYESEDRPNEILTVFNPEINAEYLKARKIREYYSR